MNKRLGCLSISGFSAVVVTVLVIAGSFWAGGGSLFNPGALSAKAGSPLGQVRSHAELAGQCAACHPAPWTGETLSERCLGCHTNVQAELKSTTSLHGAVAAQGTDMGCQNCHTEHRGASARITQVSLQNFPHDGQGFSLKTHQQMWDGRAFQCTDCHTESLTALDVGICSSCHTQHDPTYMQPHTATFGTACLNCHDGRETYGKSFDHSQVAFALTGKHSSLACASCHQGNTTLAALRSVPQGCAACHEKDDRHQGSLGQACGQCHSAESWQQASYDHSKAAFQLTGAHASVACASCHKDLLFKSTPTGCFDCHAAQDPHGSALGQTCERCHTTASWQEISFDHTQTQFPLTGMHLMASCKACHQDLRFTNTLTTCLACHQKDDPHAGTLGAECQTCHTTENWTQSTFDHNTADFQLTGAHLTTACTGCHGGMLFKDAPTQCGACHSKDDPHGGTLGANCAACHSTSSWKGSTFNHSQAPFKLAGKHAAVACTGCHADLRFKNAPTACSGCHQKDDAHGGQLGADCGQCHSPVGWSQVTFDHSRSAFPLTGAHAQAGCSSCHANAQFKSTPTQCVACHQGSDVHHGSMGTGCGSCHSTSAWKPATFDHSRSGFPLTGAHASLACGRCHANQQFAGAPTQCVGCHAEPAVHAGAFGTNCAACHSTSAWTPASFNDPHTFPMNHGNAGGACRTCHPSSYTSYTCYGCHNQGEVQNKHAELGVDFSNCMQCHPDGRSHDN